MNLSDRNRQSRLQSVIARVHRAEDRALAELNALGYRFQSIDEAEERLELTLALPGLTEDQIDMAEYAIAKRRQRRARKRAAS
ncbi:MULTISPECIES: hypothetical protein [unclassified Microbacterium]|uniref:hypothetical protein n=1 Tax=unclassified Microbacterium TaxID=2609290 RepID=UPI0036545BDA